ncbi:MAG TPA: iron-containing alcohol dehydrogenase family protein [Candidatus Blautia faecigallinarum]|uniref:Iron-containing alcohol dehydrogenase family protein n=1 Tax=Candidatus Blautia faecigallinarum TaxID=2838488 RepID=A0A9D2DRE8_9FIRM|nr:iron-containing alcohol dehydrogenase family protein [Candidatus Blautia faecigallinarum]
MKLENYEVHLPNYSIGSKIYDKIGPVCESYGKKVLVIGGEKALAAAYDKICRYVEQTNLTIIGKVLYGQNCTYETVEKLRRMPLYQEADMVFGVGGGKALDTVKCLCISDDKPVFAFPTIASNCSACTSVSIMYNEDGSFLKPHFFVRPVMHSFIDTEIIAKAPSQYMWAGIGDTYAKYYEATISSRGERLEHFTALGAAVSVMCRDPLLEFGPKAYEDHKKGLCTYDVEQVVLAIVVTTGLASIFLTKDFTPDYNSGLAHAIFYSMTSYPVIEERHLHGEVVAFGVLLTLLADQQYEEFEKVYQLNKAVGLPVSLEEIEITQEQWEECMDRIPDMSDVAHYPYKITRNMLEEAMSRLKERVKKDHEEE